MKHRVNVWALTVTLAMTITSVSLWSRIAPNYMQDLGASKTDIGLAYMLFMVAFRVPQVLGGWLADRVGRKWLIAAPMFAMVACFIAAHFAQTWQLFLASIVAAWSFSALQWPGIVAMAAESVEPNVRGRVMALIDATFFVGSTLGPAIGALLLDVMPISGLILVTAGTYCVAALIRAALLRETMPVERRPELSSARLLFWPVLMTILAFALYNLTTDGPYFSLYLEHIHTLTKPEINWVHTAGGGHLLDPAGPWEDP